MVKKQQSDVLKSQILKFLQALGFAKPTSQRLSNDALKKFADGNERHLWPHKVVVSVKHKDPDAIIKALQDVYEEHDAVEWSSNIKSRHGNYNVLKTMHSFAEFEIRSDEVQQVETDVEPAARRPPAFRSLFLEAPAEPDDGNGEEDSEDNYDDY